MSTVTMSTSSGLPRTRGSGENKGRGRVAGKGRNRSAQENATTTHPGKSVGVPLVTPRKALGVINQNSRIISATPIQKGHGKVLQASSRKSEKKPVPVVGTVTKSKQDSSQQLVSKGSRNNASCSSTVKDKEEGDESEMFPDIETMSRRQEPDEWDIDTPFEHPAYFDSLAAVFKQPLVPPPFTYLSHTSTLSSASSLKLEPDTTLRPNTVVRTASPVQCDQPFTEELDLSLELPDLDIW